MVTKFKILNRLSLLVFSSVVIISCGEKKMYEPIFDDGTAPGVVNILKSESTPGGARIYYDTPEDPDLSYVIAKYTTANGVEREVRASSYEKSLEVIGYGDTDPKQVSLYAVDTGENISEEIQTQIIPGIPPLYSVLETVDFKSKFGGFDLVWENPTSAPLGFFVLKKDDQGNWVDQPELTKYTDAKNYLNQVRSRLDTAEYAMYITDYYNNHTDTIYSLVQPMFEEEIPKSTWRYHYMPNDTKFINDVSKMWDGIETPSQSLGTARVGFSESRMITVDLGKTHTLSRVQLLPGYSLTTTTPGAYSWAAPKLLNFYACLDVPDSDGSMECWDKLGEFEVIKPSGLPNGKWTDEDIELVPTQYTFDVSESLKDYRYLRIEIIEPFGLIDGCPMARISEMNIWGVDGGMSNVEVE